MTNQPKPSPAADSLADLALVDINDILAATRASASWLHAAVRSGAFPKPAIKGVRFTRWRLADVRAWLVQRAQVTEGSQA